MNLSMRRLTPLLCGIAVLTLVVSCGGGSGGGTTTGKTPITSGTLNGLAFTVLSGDVYQDTSGGSLAAGTGEASIVFDSTISTLSATTGQVRIEAEATIADGGSVTTLAFGDPGDSFALGVGTKVLRSGTTYSYEMFWGYDATADRTAPLAALANPTSMARVITGYYNPYTPTSIAVWHPDFTGATPYDSCVAVIEATNGIGGGGNIDNGNGDRAGLNFKNAVISKVTIDDQVQMQCW